MRSAIDQIYRATGKANDGQIVRQDLREQTFNALVRFHKILCRAREHGELSALRRTAARQIDVEPGLSIELPHQAFFVSGFEVPVIRHGRRRGMIETGEQEFNRLVAIGSSMDQRVGAAGGRQTLIRGVIIAVRQQHDGNFAQSFMFAEGSAELEAVDARHQNIADHGIGQRRFGFCQRFSAVFCRRHTETEIGEISGQQFQLFRVIIDGQNDPSGSRHVFRGPTGGQMAAHRADSKTTAPPA